MKRNFLSLLTLLIFCFLGKSLSGQQLPTVNQINNYKVDPNTFLFEENLNLTTYDFLVNYRQLLNIGQNDSLSFVNYDIDSINKYIYYTFIQKHDGIPIYGSKSVFLEKPGKLHSITGNLVKGIVTVNKNQVMSDLSAITYAVNHVIAMHPGAVFMWEDINAENELKDEMGDTTATHYPQEVDMFYTFSDTHDLGSDYKLVKKISIRCANPHVAYTLFVNAITGNIERIEDDIDYCGQVGNANTWFYGNRFISTHYRGGVYSDYVLRNCTGYGGEIETKWYAPLGSIHVTNNSLSWGSSDIDATTAHFCASQTRQYYWDRFSRDGLNNDGVKINIRLYVPKENARFLRGTNTIELGKRKSDGHALVAQDIIAHEYTHGIIKYTANLKGSKRASAINEAISDIFGEAVERFTKVNCDWLAGGELFDNGRSMSNPQSKSYPSFYEGAYWDFTEDSFHKNSTMVSHCFYKIADKIGFEKMISIVYNSLRFQLHNTSDYYHFRTSSIISAQVLYGTCSPEVNAVIESWDEVGVYGIPAPNYNCAALSGLAYDYCTSLSGQTVNYNCMATTTKPGITNWTWTISNPSALDGYAFGINNIHFKITKFNSTSSDIVLTATGTGSSGTISISHTIRFKTCFSSNPLLPGIKIMNPSDLSIRNFKPSRNIEEINDILVFPNPTKDEINIQLPTFEKGGLMQVYGLDGKLYMEEQIGNKKQLNLGKFAKGIYLIQVKTINRVYSAKITLN